MRPIKAIEEYENTYIDPFGANSYQTAGFKKKKGKVSAKPTMLSSQHIPNLNTIDLPVVRQKSQTPIIIFDITDEEKSKFDDTAAMLNILRKYNEETYMKYRTYEAHCWKIDTPEKCDKWCLNSMSKKNAYSSETNVRNKTQNVLMIYLHENRLIISAWNGKEN